MAFTIDLAGRVALVTGASSGLGAQFARTLAAAGATVVLAARRTDRLKALQQSISEQGGSAHVVSLDVTSAESIEAAVAQAEAQAGPIDILINNSGVSRGGRLQDTTPEDFDFVMNTNVKGAYFVAQAVSKRMLARAKATPSGQVQGRIVNIASVAGIKAVPQISVYCMSKAAVIHMTRCMAAEWGRFGINVNAICPGYIDTDINHDHWQTEAGQKLINMLPRKRVGQPHDLDTTLLMLVAPQSGFVNGSIISTDDGFLV